MNGFVQANPEPDRGCQIGSGDKRIARTDLTF